MHTAVKLSTYGAALALIAGGGYAIGTAVDPVPMAATSGHGQAPSGAVADTAIDRAAGLASSTGGYSLAPTASRLTSASTPTFSFRIIGPDGTPVTTFDVEHDKRMHLVVVRQDTTEFQHLHPEMAADGTWSVPLSVPVGGTYRVFADFTPAGGPATTLGTNVDVAGTYEPVGHPPSRTAQIGDYTVQLTGELVPGRDSPVTLAISRDGAPVTDLQPYLAAYGHLVALREGDLAYLHVHPEGAPGDGRTPAGPTIRFVAEVPSTGTYRLFLDFQHNGVVRTAEFTVPTGSAPSTSDQAASDRGPGTHPAGSGHGQSHGH